MNSNETPTVAAHIHFPCDDLVTFEFRGDGVSINVVEHVGTGDEWVSLDNTEEYEEAKYVQLIEIFGHESEVIEAMNAAVSDASVWSTEKDRDSLKINFNISFDVSTTRGKIKKQLKLTGFHFVEDEIKLLADKIEDAFLDGDYQHAFLDGGGRFNPMRDDGAYLQYITEWVLELYTDSRK